MESKKTNTPGYILISVSDAATADTIHKAIPFSPTLNNIILAADGRRMTFGMALEALKEGYAVRLPQWSPEVMIRLQKPDANSKMTHPYLYVESRYGCVPWKETFVELLSDKWEVVSGSKLPENN